MERHEGRRSQNNNSRPGEILVEVYAVRKKQKIMKQQNNVVSHN